MTRSVHLQLVVDGAEDEPMNLDSRRVQDGDQVTAIDLANICLETAVRLIAWSTYRDRFDQIAEQMGEAS